MSGEWKRGDVAMVTCPDAHRVGMRGRAALTSTMGWHTADGWFNDATVTEVRPLVVIDPEDAEQVAALSSALMRQLVYPHAVPYDQAIPAALRLLVEPKPDEPLGDGAVVEDRFGDRWVRIPAPQAEVDPKPWRRLNFSARDWEHVPAVKVLSEGVAS